AHKAAKAPVLAKRDQAFVKVLRHDVDPPVPVDSDLEWTVIEIRGENAGHVGFRRADRTDEPAVGIKMNDARVACIRDVERFIGGDIKTPRRVEPVRAAGMFKLTDDADQAPLRIQDDDPVIAGIGDVDMAARADVEIVRASKIADAKIFPPDKRDGQIRLGSRDRLPPVIVGVALVGDNKARDRDADCYGGSARYGEDRHDSKPKRGSKFPHGYAPHRPGKAGLRRPCPLNLRWMNLIDYCLRYSSFIAWARGATSPTMDAGEPPPMTPLTTAPKGVSPSHQAPRKLW